MKRSQIKSNLHSHENDKRHLLSSLLDLMISLGQGSSENTVLAIVSMATLGIIASLSMGLFVVSLTSPKPACYPQHQEFLSSKT